SLDRLRAMLVCNAIALTVVLACGVPLISIYGAKGAAIALVAAELTLGLSYERALAHKRPALRLAPGFVMRAAAATLFAGAAASVLSLPAVAAAALGFALYVAALLVLGIIPAEIREALIRRGPPPV
ncbi:MAG TPA: hypothetical protein VK680_03635, partial [Solirubrobacteraceae bacterium]|nr:hypothetical protein [Solirubrobacteraceae bacterium]